MKLWGNTTNGIRQDGVRRKLTPEIDDEAKEPMNRHRRLSLRIRYSILLYSHTVVSTRIAYTGILLYP